MSSRKPQRRAPGQPTQPYYPPQQPPDPWAQNRPQYLPEQPYSIVEQRRRQQQVYRVPRKPRRPGPGCCGCIAILGVLGLLLAVYLLFPGRTNVLLLGIDYTRRDNAVARSDTMILSTFLPLKPYVGMLSIPRDLWVNIPGVGENRINTAHFFAEASQAGSGPAAAMETVRSNFGVNVGYYVRIRFEGFRDVVDAMGGLDVDLPEPMAGYDAGRVHLTGRKALAFARSRAGSDDFFRMQHGQILLKAMFRQMMNPVRWWRSPAVVVAAGRSLDTNIPFVLWPRLGFALLRTGPGGIDNRTITREMVTGITTDQGANVLLPNWAAINPVLMEMFGQ